MSPCGWPPPTRPPRPEQVKDQGRFPDLRVVTLPGLPSAQGAPVAYRTGSPPTVAGAVPDLAAAAPDSLLPEASLGTLIVFQISPDGRARQYEAGVEIFMISMSMTSSYYAEGGMWCGKTG